MANNLKWKDPNSEIEYSNLIKPKITTGFPFAIEQYETDGNGNITKAPLPLINATDINWGGVKLGSIAGIGNPSTIETTDELLNFINLNSQNLEGASISVIAMMLNAIRNLQTEVTKLRNSFRFGINSYTGEDFSMPETMAELEDVEPNEPLWATDESELTFIEGLDLSQGSYQYINPTDNYNLMINDKISYHDTITFNIPKDDNGENLFKTLNYNKEYVYITCTSKNIDIVFESESSNLTINVKDIVKVNYLPEKYNILVIVSKKIENEVNNEVELVGNNFIWISLSEWGTGNNIFNGYFDESGKYDQIAPETPIYNENIYNISSINFYNTNDTDYLYKLDVYSRYQVVSNPIEAAIPTDVENYKYRSASITIRSMASVQKIENNIKKLQNNELIYCEANKKLYIYTNGNLINIGSGGSGQGGSEGGSEGGSNTPGDNNMENYQVIKALAEQGIIKINFKDSTHTSYEDLYAPSNINSYELNDIITLNDISEINFINDDTGKKFNITVNPYGEFDIKEIVESKTLEQTYGEAIAELPGDFKSDRSFVSLIKAIKNGKTNNISKDLKDYADRIQIGMIYAPLKSDVIHGCTHGFIELFNSSQEDFPLDGCYLHYSCVDNADTSTSSENVSYYYLPLNGYIPAGGTYLIRCKQYSDYSDINTFINVDKYDIEWYIENLGKKELLDLSMTSKGSYQFLLTYGRQLTDGTYIDQNTTVALNAKIQKPDSSWDSTKGLYSVIKGFIDSCRLGNDWGSKNTTHWVPLETNGNKACQYTIYSNTIYKVTFELDPAKQAFNSLTTSDSSRQRWQNAATDYQYVNLDRKYIEFPKSDLKKLVSDYTPKASFQHKNVMTDKTQLNPNEPNAIVCSYGLNPYTTRCFNWISNGKFDEAVVIIDPDTNEECVFESYTNKKYTTNDEIKVSTFSKAKNVLGKDLTIDWPRKHEFNSYINNIVYGSGYVIHNVNKSNESWEYGLESDAEGKRIYNKFPGNNISYTSHKCIIDLCKDYTYDSSMTAKTYKYYICRLDKFKHLDKSYKSDIKEFTLYPKNYTPKVYQITDQQGFHWIEYQVWAAAAKKMQYIIENDVWNHNGDIVPKNRTTPKGIMPIIVNTGDCVQSGARLNEWIDYFDAGKYLFDYYEQLNLVGNNDLCDIDVNALGTGDDVGKSNGYFFHLFNCYQIDDTEITGSDTSAKLVTKYLPIIKNIYVPSLYYIDINIADNKVTRLIFINSEITETTCKSWYKLVHSDNKNINIYTGWTISSSDSTKSYVATNSFTPIYDILWHWTNNNTIGYLPLCHEMPFTVITNKCLRWKQDLGEYSKYRSQSDASKLIGCHCNQINDTEAGKGLHWMSRLFEYRGIKLCLGGHKHTYACTYPVRENYLYIKSLTSDEAQALNNVHSSDSSWITLYAGDIYNESLTAAEVQAINNVHTESEWTQLQTGEKLPEIILWSYIDGPMIMPPSLKNDTVEWKIYDYNTTTTPGREINLSKFPIVNRPLAHQSLDSGNITLDVTYEETTFNEITEENETTVYTVYQTTTSHESPSKIKKDGNDKPILKQIIIGEGDNATKYFVYELTGEDVSYDFYKENNEMVAEQEVIDVTGNIVSITPSRKLSDGTYQKLYNDDSTKIGIKITKQDTKQSPQRFFPFIDKLSTDNRNYVIYLMCQATGYKLTSNKELPSEFQKFSMVIPKSYIDTSFNDKPSEDQTMPMFTIVDFDKNNINKFKVQLGRMRYISKNDNKMTFTQLNYGTNDIRVEYLILSSKSIYGIWCHYDTKKSCYIQDDVFKSSKVKLTYNGTSTTEFNKDNNTGNILYSDLLTINNQYLFDTSKF